MTAEISPKVTVPHFDVSDPAVVEYKMPYLYNPQASDPTDDYRCFVTNEFTSDYWINADDVVPENHETVHHVIAYLPQTETDEAKALSKGQGYICFAGPAAPVKPVAANLLDKIKITCSYNTTQKTSPVVFGEGSEDEMCSVSNKLKFNSWNFFNLSLKYNL